MKPDEEYVDELIQESFGELFAEEEFKEVFNEVEQFTDEMLSEYNTWLRSIILSGESKKIFDAL